MFFNSFDEIVAYESRKWGSVDMSVFNDGEQPAPPSYGNSHPLPPYGRVYSSFNELAIENGMWDWVKRQFGVKPGMAPNTQDPHEQPSADGAILPETDAKDVFPMQQVDSSYLAKVGYDANDHVMTVMFWDGSVFDYDNVSEAEYKQLMGATSHGQWFYWNIRTAKPFEQVEARKTTQHPGFATRQRSKSSEWTGSPW